MATIKYRFHFPAEPARLYKALTEIKQIRHWLTEDSSGEMIRGTVAAFQWKKQNWQVQMRIEKLDPGRSVEWKCVGSNMQNTDAWVGSTVHFQIDLAKDMSGSTLRFEHRDYKESPCLKECDAGWLFALGTSLKEYLETGTGRPYRA